MQRVLDAARRDPWTVLALALVVGGALYVVVYPFTLVHHPPITDLPFHAAQISIFRHFRDPAFHFQEQFSLHPFEVPYVTMYGVGVLASFVMSIAAAVKLSAIVMLLLLPLGLAIFFRGLGKSPLWGVLGLCFVWTDLTHWGFLSFVGALGLYAASIGCALLVVERPTRFRRAALCLCLVGVFFTHVYRFPFAILAVGLAGVVSQPSARRLRPLLAPIAAPLGLFLVWLGARPKTLAGGLALGTPDLGRVRRIPEFLFSSYLGRPGVREHEIAVMLLLAVVGVGALAFAFREPQKDDERRARRALSLLPIALALGHLLAYLVLPARVGEWWYVYPREIVAAAYIGVGALPDLPRRPALRLAAIGVVIAAAGRMGHFVADQWLGFDRVEADFREIDGFIPQAPKLSYLIVDHRGSDKRHSPFVHLPAWIQAEKGGALSFHFAGWGIFPVRYRSDSSDVPPAVPRDWEWHPEWYDVHAQARFFDWFLVRTELDPGPSIFASEPSLGLVAHRGSWWLYGRPGNSVPDSTELDRP